MSRYVLFADKVWSYTERDGLLHLTRVDGEGSTVIPESTLWEESLPTASAAWVLESEIIPVEVSQDRIDQWTQDHRAWMEQMMDCGHHVSHYSRKRQACVSCEAHAPTEAQEQAPEDLCECGGTITPSTDSHPALSPSESLCDSCGLVFEDETEEIPVSHFVSAIKSLVRF